MIEDGDIDYKSRTLEQLRESCLNIDRQRYPRNLANLLLELKARGATDPVSEQHPGEPKSQRSANRLLTAILLAATGATAGWLLANEPTSTAWCEDIRILGVKQGSRSTEYFEVESLKDSRVRLIGRFNKPFSKDYTGPAALWISVGRLTGREHYKMSARCSDAPPSN
ncbi:hypothetical protein [Nevskia soli]|uniref:hypothetical protein n=1 Tax=Nevskia soli TaxID=418856 RepID=UPI0012F93B9E|nr:hypothetical protein [Nevskia soli]